MFAFFFILSGVSSHEMNPVCSSEADYDQSLRQILGVNFSDFLSTIEKFKSHKTSKNEWGVKLLRKKSKLKKDIFVKIADLEKDPERLKRLFREIVFYQDISQNKDFKGNLPLYYGCVNAGSTFYLISELLDHSIKKYIIKSHRGQNSNGYQEFLDITGTEQLKFLLEIAQSIDEIHKIGRAITNIDSKNIFIRKVNEISKPFLTNFGYLQYLPESNDRSNILIIRK